MRGGMEPQESPWLSLGAATPKSAYCKLALDFIGNALLCLVPETPSGKLPAEAIVDYSEAISSLSQSPQVCI